MQKAIQKRTSIESSTRQGREKCAECRAGNKKKKSKRSEHSKKQRERARRIKQEIVEDSSLPCPHIPGGFQVEWFCSTNHHMDSTHYPMDSTHTYHGFHDILDGFHIILLEK